MVSSYCVVLDYVLFTNMFTIALKDACKADPDGPDTACPLEGVLKMRCMVPIDGSKSPMMVPNPDYVDFCKFYLPYTVGKKDRFKPFCTEQHISEFVTVTDEVFAIISYENSEQRWEAGYQEDLKEAQEQLKNDYLALTRRNTKTGKKRKKSVEDQEDEDHVGDRGKLSAGCRVNVPNKYTNTPKVDEKAGSNRRLCGWSEEGMRRFNKLKDMVAKNRQEECAQEFEEAVRQACIELYGNKKVQTDEEDTSTKPLSVEAKHDLFSDSSDDDEGEEESRSNSTDDGSQKSENDGGEEESSEDEE